MPEEFPVSLFEMLYRRTPGEQEKTRLLGVKAALGLSDRDEFWPVIMTLDHYSLINTAARRDIIRAMETLPDQVKAVISNSERAFALKADQATAHAVEKGAEQLAQIIHRFQVTADRFGKRQFMIAASIGAIAALLCLGAGGAGGYFVTTSLMDMCTSKIFRTEEQRLGCYID